MFKALFKRDKKRTSGERRPELYLHIGMGKTGTTALQEFFWLNRKELAKHDICYPEYAAVSAAHHRLSPHVPLFLENTWKFEKAEDWAPKLSNLKERRVLLSSELVAWSKPEVAQEFCEKLTDWFDVYVVIYLRRQDSLIMAGYNQQIKAGTQVKNIDAVLTHQFNRFNYREKIRPWVEALGKEKIIVRPYERSQFFESDIRYDFLYHVFGIRDFSEFEVQNKNSNPRLSYAAMEYKRWINGLFSDTSISSKYNKVLLDYSAKTDSGSTSIYASSSVLSPEARIDILEKCQGINAEIAREFLNRGDGRLFYDPLPSSDDSWVDPACSDTEFEAISEFIRVQEPGLYKKLAPFLADRKVE